MNFDDLFIEDLGKMTDGMFGDNQVTSQAIGEEDSAPGGVTSTAIGEEDGPMTPEETIDLSE